ncbi:promethin-like isoform X1 [Sphaeramia orbicularis]|uniref:promethin-like isoform X1 n=1 Tax=Sphaeramia orbicularis TaxID=375764 RepID=UPI00117C1CF2|nr:promethin isoform X1 [Sphaeramia orbicularis]
MQQGNSVSGVQQLYGSWTTLLNRLYNDPKVTQLMNSRIGLYIRTHPFLGLAVLLFSAMSAVPVGIFLIFSLVTIIMTAVGFVFFELFVLFVGGVTLLCVLSGLAFFSVVASLIFSAFSVTITNVLKSYYPQLATVKTTQSRVTETENVQPQN